MDLDRAQAMAAKNLINGASLDELHEIAQDLRALSPDSVLAELVEAKIERLLRHQLVIQLGLRSTSTR
jgi:hypothetical protein